MTRPKANLTALRVTPEERQGRRSRLRVMTGRRASTRAWASGLGREGMARRSAGRSEGPPSFANVVVTRRIGRSSGPPSGGRAKPAGHALRIDPQRGCFEDAAREEAPFVMLSGWRGDVSRPAGSSLRVAWGVSGGARPGARCGPLHARRLETASAVVEASGRCRSCFSSFSSDGICFRSCWSRFSSC